MAEFSPTIMSILEIIRTCHPDSNDVIPLHVPVLGQMEKDFLCTCVDSSFVSSVGAYVERFEHEVADFCGVRRAVATVNGTAALHVALLLVGVAPGELVLTQSLTFIATANAVRNCGAEPLFLDVSRDTLGLSPKALEEYLTTGCRREGERLVDVTTGRRVAACMPMHTFGHPAELPRLAVLCAQYGLPLVEDAAEALGSRRDGRHVGAAGCIATLSFNGNKLLTTGGGGMILTNDDALADRAKHLTTTAKIPHPWEYRHDEQGYNYRLPNVNAALGCAQMTRLPEVLVDKRRLAEEYAQAFARVGVEFVQEPAGCASNYWLNAVLTPGRMQRDALLVSAAAAGIQCRPAWTPIHRLPLYAACPRRDLPVTEELADRLVNIPSSPRIHA